NSNMWRRRSPSACSGSMIGGRRASRRRPARRASPHSPPEGATDFPNSILDEELGLLPGELTPSLVESLVRLGTWLPFLPAAWMLAHFTRVRVGATTARRLTTQAGTAYEAVQTAAVERLERELPADPQGPAVQLLSVD